MICKYIEYIYSIIDSTYNIEYVRSIPIPCTYKNTDMYTRVYIFIFIIIINVGYRLVWGGPPPKKKNGYRIM